MRPLGKRSFRDRTRDPGKRSYRDTRQDPWARKAIGTQDKTPGQEKL
jgi:hypothetical protein